MKTLLPAISLPEGELTSETLFGRDCPVWLEIGFGGGEHLVRIARQNPEAGIIGAEPFIDGVAKALTGISGHGLQNIRIHADDVRYVLARLPENTISRVFILFPDPWPKRRQQKRRLIQPAFLEDLARTLKPGAKLRFATDVASYADEALTRFLAHGAFDWLAERALDWQTQPEDHEPTRYQLKGLGDCAPVWLEFEYRPG